MRGGGIVQVAAVAVRDYWHDRWLSLCAVLGLAAVLAPLLVLFGLKHGIVSSLLADLRARPEVRQIQPLGQGHYDAAWFDALAARPEVGFLVPTTRYLSATLEILPPGGGRPVRAEMVPSLAGDPLWAGPPPAEAGGGMVEAVLSRPLAETLGVSEGQVVEARLGRVVDGLPQAVRLPVRVGGVLALDASGRDAILVPPSLLLDAEDYREGLAVLARGWPGTPPAAAAPPRRFASFRLYAADLDGVEPLREHLVGLGVEVETAADRIAMTRRLDHALTVLFVVVSGLAVGGYALSLALAQAVSVARKQREISVLKVLGAGNAAVALMPVTQAVLTGLIGAVVAVAAQAAAEPLINGLFADGLRDGQVVSHLLNGHRAAAIAGTVLLAAASAVAAGLRAAAVPPGEGLRDD
ncbi:FtsX-like permease family protein [Novispirillum sp. DQ9]|uniref:FtsX-like permease family protein n=1 Tax=Novispirillum sp. DQ9 TaxID=3398612 RepID=UPI003C7B8EC4